MKYFESLKKMSPGTIYFGIWLLAYTLEYSDMLISHPIWFLGWIPFSALFGFLILPQNLLHNLFGLTYDFTPLWLQWVSIVSYWGSVWYLKVRFARTRRWILLLILSVIILISFKGCSTFSGEELTLMEG